MIPKILLLGSIVAGVGVAWWNHGKRTQVMWGPAAAWGVAEALLLWWSWS